MSRFGITTPGGQKGASSAGGDQNNENDQPSHVEEMPVGDRVSDAGVASGTVSPLKRLRSNPTEQDETSEDVRGMEAGEREESEFEQGCLRGNLSQIDLPPIQRLEEKEKDAESHGCRKQSAEARLVSFPNGGERQMDGHAARDEDEGVEPEAGWKGRRTRRRPLLGLVADDDESNKAGDE